MRLVDLDPRWFAEPGREGQGIVFLCPHCRGGYIAVPFANPLDGGAPFDVGTEQARPIRRLWEILYGDVESPAEKGTMRAGAVLPVGAWVIPPGCLWQRTGDTFETLSLSPSVDASRAGCWHGFLTNGAIT
jgi:hypothetical protein